MRRALFVLLCIGALSAPANGQPPTRCGDQEVTFARLPAWSPDGTKIAFECSGICVMNADGSGKKVLGEISSDSVDRQPAWSPDGRKIAFIRQTTDTALYVMNADGSGATRLSADSTSPEMPSWSPDGTSIAYSEDGPDGATIYVMRADGAQRPARVAAGANRSSRAAWSPDGTRIAFQDSEGKLAIASVDGKSRTTVGSATGREPAWSPSGQTIAFTDSDDRRHAVFTIGVDGTHRVQLTSDGENEEPSWSPDGRRIAFTSERDGMPATYVMAADGTVQTRLFDNPVALSHLAWSPAGRRIAFAALGRVGVDGIYAIDDDGGHLQRLTSGPDNRDERPAWSPDGRMLAFTRIRNKGSSRLYLINADGSGLKEITEDAESAAWMPDGRRIAFKSFGGGSRPIRSVALDGTGLATLIGSFDTFGDPVFSRDGRRIAFQIFYGGTGVLRVMNADGSGGATIASQVHITAFHRPAWSSSGGRLAFARARTDDRCEGIDVVNADGTERRTLTSSADVEPAWSPDDARIAFVSRRDGYDAIYVMKADGSEPARITSDFRPEHLAPRIRMARVRTIGIVTLCALALAALAVARRRRRDPTARRT